MLVFVQSSERLIRSRRLAVYLAMMLALPVLALSQSHVIEVMADKDSRYRIAGQSKPEIVLKAGEPVLLRINARKGKTWNRDGAVHGFTLLTKDKKKVAGWDIELKAGAQEFSLVAPTEPGEYTVLCTVVCSEDHENMHMRLVVVP